MKLIEGMSEQVGEELRGELVKHKEVAKRQQEQLESQQGRIKQLEDIITAMKDGAPAGVGSYDGEDMGEEEGEGRSLRWGKRRSGNGCGRAGRRGGS